MLEFRPIYDEIIAYLEKSGFGGYVDSLNNYKNLGTTPIKTPNQNIPTSTQKNQNESPAASYLLDSGASSPSKKVLS